LQFYFFKIALKHFSQDHRTWYFTNASGIDNWQEFEIIFYKKNKQIIPKGNFLLNFTDHFY